MAGGTYTIRTGYGRECHMTRDMVRRGLDSDLPGGLDTLFHTLSYAMLSANDFLDACRHFGLDHLLFDITDAEIGAELEARRARGAPPTARELPFAVNGEGDRELADAMLDAYERRVADAEAMAAARAAAMGDPPGGPLPTGTVARPFPPLPRSAGEQVHRLRTANQGTVELTRGGLRRLLGLVLPHGLAYVPYCLYEHGVTLGDLRRACRRLGLDHLLLDVPIREVLAELTARRARGAPPTGRELPLMVGEEEREYADAMLDVYERKAAAAEAETARVAALEAAPRAA